MGMDLVVRVNKVNFFSFLRHGVIEMFFFSTYADLIEFP